MKKTIALILGILLVALIAVSCVPLIEKSEEQKPVSDSNENLQIITLGDTGYSLALDEGFEKFDFFDVEDVSESYNLVGVYYKGESFFLIYSGHTDRTMEEEAEALYDEVLKNYGEISYTTDDFGSIEYFSLPGYEYASFETDIAWENGTEKSLKVSAIIKDGQYASIYYFVPKDNTEAINQREKILNENIIENR